MKTLRIVPVLMSLTLLNPPTPAAEPLADQVKTAINNGVRYLRDLENGKGDFEHTTADIGIAHLDCVDDFAKRNVVGDKRVWV